MNLDNKKIRTIGPWCFLQPAWGQNTTTFLHQHCFCRDVFEASRPKILLIFSDEWFLSSSFLCPEKIHQRHWQARKKFSTLELESQVPVIIINFRCQTFEALSFGKLKSWRLSVKKWTYLVSYIIGTNIKL